LKISILSTVANDTLIFRRELISKLVAAGHVVFVFCVDYTDQTRDQIQSLGAMPIDYGLSRAGLNPLADLLTIFQLWKLLNEVRSDVVLSCFVKPSIYGSIAARLACVPRRLAMLEGLGFVFTDTPSGPSAKQRLLRKIQVFLYRLALPSIDTIIFLNPDDPVDLLEKNNLKAKHVEVLGGIGVDLKQFAYSEPPVEPVRFIFIARLLAEKGVFEYLEAVKRVKRLHPAAEFVVLGGIDEANPGGLKQADLQNLLDTELIIYPGYVNNVPDWIAGSSVFVLPSYREGVPRSTQEALAIGRAVITTDVPGCRETVIEGVNGFLVPKWDADALADKMIYFIENPAAIKKMGHESHRLAVERFDAEKVNARLMKIMGLSELR